jgi:putative nucleotidyltransferase with HDIG domain
MNTKNRLQAVIARITEIPAMPEIVAEVLRITDDPETTMGDVGAAVERDPALAVKILKVSNSTYYGMKQHVATLKLALVILGVREIRNIVMAISVFESLRARSTDSLLAREFWEHSFKVAGIARKLGVHMQLALHGEDFIAGLLHDIGKMIMVRQFAKEYFGLYERTGGCGNALWNKEMEVFGFSHAEAGAALARNWNLPPSLTDALMYHHYALADGTLRNLSNPKLACVVRIANLASREDYTTLTPDRSEACVDQEAWTILNEGPLKISNTGRFNLFRDCQKELSQSHPPMY